jgi:hypothetical protein
MINIIIYTIIIKEEAFSNSIVLICCSVGMI